MESVQIVVICSAHKPEREARMRRQLAALRVTAAVHFLAGRTPSSSPDWVCADVAAAPRGCPIPANPYVQCCMGSHAAAVGWFARASTLDVLIVLEDDVALATDFSERLREALVAWPPEVELLALGYAPYSDTFLGRVGARRGGLVWKLGEPLWGALAYAMRRPTARKLAPLFSAPSILDLARAADGYAVHHTVNQTKALRAVSDVLLDYFLEYGAVVPPLAVEAPVESALSFSNSNFPLWTSARDRGLFAPLAYYESPFADASRPAAAT